MTNASPFDWWRAALAGKKPAIHANDPQPGYFRGKHDGAPVAAMIFPNDNGGLSARLGNIVVDPYKVWVQLARHPITEEAARCWFEHGRWPHEEVLASDPSHDDGTLTGIGHNSGVIEIEDGGAADIFDEISRKAQIEVDHATEWLKRSGVKDQKQADICGDMIDAMRKLWKRADDARADEKQPHLDAERAVDNKWRPVLKSLKDAGDALKDAAVAWKRAEDARRAKEAAEAEAAHLAAIEAAQAKGELPVDVPELPPAPEPVRIGGTSGRRIGFRTTETVVVIDVAKAYRLKAIKEHPAVLAAIEAACNDLFKATGKVPAGCEKRTHTRAA